jgi:predicted amidohydrolase YtcJ
MVLMAYAACRRRGIAWIDLDDAMGDDGRPVFLWRACWHIGCANTAGLAAAGLRAGAPVPPTPGGVVDVDKKGHPTGVLRERATDLITPFTEEKDQLVRRKYFEAGVAQCVAQGLTSLQSNDGGGAERGNRGGSWEHYVAMEQAGTLPLRVFLTVDYSDLAGGLAPPSGSTGAGGPSSLVKCDRVKLFGDGSLGAETAAIRGAYNAEDGEERPPAAAEEGVLIQSDAELAAKIRDAKGQGYRLEIHAIGDRAAASVLDGLEAAGVTPDDRAVITHCQLLGADLISRMGAMQTVANIQPQFVVTDAPFARVRVPARIQEHAYAWRTLLEKGIPCAGGSDAPVELPTPLIGMHDAIFRYGAGADPATAYRPTECLTFEQALDLYTIGAAYACGEEHRLGKIKVGYAADLTVLDQDVSVDPQLLASARVEQVWVAGVPRFDRVRAGVLPPAVQLGGPYIPGKNGPALALPPLGSIRLPHRLACGGGMRAPGSGCGCSDAARCGRVPFADTFLVGAKLGLP